MEIAAKAQNVSQQVYIENTISSDAINGASQQFQLYKSKLTPDEMWEHQKLDMKGLFSDDFIASRWQKIRKQYPEDFQNLVENELITNTTLKTKNYETESSPFKPKL